MPMKRLCLLSFALLSILGCRHDAPQVTWGDTGDGEYLNPVLLADYSDPDAIRVGDRYYMVA